MFNSMFKSLGWQKNHDYLVLDTKVCGAPFDEEASWFTMEIRGENLSAYDNMSDEEFDHIHDADDYETPLIATVEGQLRTNYKNSSILSELMNLEAEDGDLGCCAMAYYYATQQFLKPVSLSKKSKGFVYIKSIKIADNFVSDTIRGAIFDDFHDLIRSSIGLCPDCVFMIPNDEEQDIPVAAKASTKVVTVTNEIVLLRFPPRSLSPIGETITPEMHKHIKSFYEACCEC